MIQNPNLEAEIGYHLQIVTRNSTAICVLSIIHTYLALTTQFSVSSGMQIEEKRISVLILVEVTLGKSPSAIPMQLRKLKSLGKR